MTSAYLPQTTISARQDLLSRDFDDTEMVMVDIDRGIYYGLEGAGKLLWDALREPQSVAALIDLVMVQYEDAERATVERDLAVFLDELREEALIEVHHNG